VKETYLEYLKILKKIVTTNFIKYEKYWRRNLNWNTDLKTKLKRLRVVYVI
jgi:hypothetical protein